MPSDSITSTSLAALDDFRNLRNKAILREIMARLSGQPVGLLSFEEVRRQLKAQTGADRGLQDIPLDAIIGSVNRYEDFTRDFLPREGIDRHRWAHVKTAMDDMAGLPPIEVYQLGEVYFVKDGNHRVSVARQVGATSIQGYVTEVRSPVPLTPDVRPEDLIIKAEQVEFLERTQMHQTRPQAELTLTAAGQYAILSEHISVHRYFMGLEQKRPISESEAAADWYDTVYLPAVQAIRRRALLRDFPGRTETDLYLWLADHRAELEKTLGWQVGTEAAADDLAHRFSPRLDRLIHRLTNSLRDRLTIEPLEPGPPPGFWRQERIGAQRNDRLFARILTPISGSPKGWVALEQALVIAHKENSQIYGLHVHLPEAREADLEPIQKHFEQRCQEENISGNLALVNGVVSSQIRHRSHWSDLVVVNLSYPPLPQPLRRFRSGFRAIIQGCEAPVLAAPRQVSSLRSALLAYDGSPKAEEALYVATYLAGQWQIPLVVITVLQKDRVLPETQAKARAYLEAHGVQASYVVEKRGPVAAAILINATLHSSDLIIMGGYRRGPLLNVIFDDVVDRVLRSTSNPVLLCR